MKAIAISRMGFDRPLKGIQQSLNRCPVNVRCFNYIYMHRNDV